MVDQFRNPSDPPVEIINPTEEQMARVRMIRGGEHEEITAFDWALIGTKTKLIGIPLEKPWLFRSFVPDQLRALATFMEQKSADPNIPLRYLLAEIGAETRATSRRIEHKVNDTTY